MTIPRLPGWGEEIGAILPQLGNNLAHLLNPNLERENMLKNAIAQDPRILQQLVEQESINPGTLQKMGFGNIAKTIQGMQPSEAFLNKRAIDQATADEIKNNPALARDAGYRAITGESRLDTKIKEQQSQQNQAALEEIPLLHQKNLAELYRIQNENKKGDQANTRRGLAQDWLAQNKGKNVRQIALDIINGGQISPEVGAGLMENNPAIKEAIDKIKDEDRIAAEKDFISLRNSSNKQDVVERYRASTASRIYDELDTTDFTFDDLYNHINGKGVGETPEMAAKIDAALQNMKGEKRGKLMNAVRNSLTAAQNEALRIWKVADDKGLKPEAIAGQLKPSAIAIQSALEQLSPLTGEHYQVEFVDKIPKTKNFLGLGGDFGLVIRDSAGNEVNPLELGKKSNAVDMDLMAKDLQKNPKLMEDKNFKQAWDLLTPEQRDSVSKMAKITPKTSVDSTKSEEVKKINFKADTTGLPPVEKTKVPTGKAELDPIMVSQIDTLSPGLSQSDSIKSLAASDSINAVNEIWGLAKDYVDSKYKSWPAGLNGKRLQAFSDAVKIYRAQHPEKKQQTNMIPLDSLKFDKTKVF